MRIRKSRESGSAILEFSLAAVPILLTLVFTVEVGRAVWTYHTLAYNVKAAARAAAVKGAGCASPNNCRATLGSIARIIRGIGLDPAAMSVTLSPAAAVSCAPLSNCLSDTSFWPPDGNNTPGSTVIEIGASYNFISAFGRYTLTARSRQPLLF